MFDVGMEIEMLSFLLAGEGDDMAAQRTIFHGARSTISTILEKAVVVVP
jgi:Fe-S cluster assembly scaffold protein SufB